MSEKPKYHLDVYRKFIREAAPYVSIVVGRKVSPKEAETLTDEQLTPMALLIDMRVEDLDKSKPPGGGAN